MKKIFRREIQIGLSALCALAILFFGIDFLKGINLFHASNYYFATYNNVNGLAISAPVTVNGFKVGQVRTIEYQYDNPGTVKVELSLDGELKLPEGSRALLTTDMLGTASIALELANGTNYIPIGSKIEGGQAAGLMDGITNDIMPAIAAIAPKVDTLLTTTNRLLSDPALAASIQRMDAITANLQTSSTYLNRTVAQMPAIAGDVKAITGNFTGTSEQLLTFSNTMNRLPMDSLASQIQITTANLRMLTEQLNDRNSTLGLLMNDPALYNNLNSTVRSLDSLFVDIKAHPKRYISIKLL